MNKNSILSMLSLAAKAGKVVSGEFSTEKAVKTGKGFLVVLAEDASDNTKKKFSNMCAFYEVPLVAVAPKEELGRAIGKEFRASLAVTDADFTKAILQKMEKIDEIQQRKAK